MSDTDDNESTDFSSIDGSDVDSDCNDKYGEDSRNRCSSKRNRYYKARKEKNSISSYLSSNSEALDSESASDTENRYSKTKSKHHLKTKNNKQSDDDYEKRRNLSKKRTVEKKKRKKNSRDKIVHFHWKKGMKLSDRYIVMEKIGEGTFGRVLRCLDTEKNRYVAIKVVRGVRRYANAAKIEASILRELKQLSNFDYRHCVIIYDSFLYKNKNMCLVFECLGMSLYDFLSENRFQGFYIYDIQRIAIQGLLVLDFFYKSKITHTDLKPENILLHKNNFIRCNFPRAKEGSSTSSYLRPDNLNIKIIDFGSATFEDEYHSTLINTRQYRAPEVILDTGWNMASDMWSFGCILIELYTGKLLFKTHEHLEHLAMMERIIEPFPKNMLEKAKDTDGRNYIYFEKRNSLSDGENTTRKSKTICRTSGFSSKKRASNPFELTTDSNPADTSESTCVANKLSALPSSYHPNNSTSISSLKTRGSSSLSLPELKVPRLRWPDEASSSSSIARVRKCRCIHVIQLYVSIFSEELHIGHVYIFER